MGNITYIGDLITRKFLPFKVFYFGVSFLLIDYLTKFKEVYHLKMKPKHKNYEINLDCLLKFLERVGKYA